MAAHEWLRPVKGLSRMWYEEHQLVQGVSVKVTPTALSDAPSTKEEVGRAWRLGR